MHNGLVIVLKLVSGNKVIPGPGDTMPICLGIHAPDAMEDGVSVVGSKKDIYMVISMAMACDDGSGYSAADGVAFATALDGDPMNIHNLNSDHGAVGGSKSEKMSDGYVTVVG